MKPDRERIEPGEGDREPANFSGVRGRDIGGDNEILSGRMERAEDLEVFGFEAGGVPFALDGIGDAAAAGEDEIQLMPVLVSPIHDRRLAGVGKQAVEDEMLPEEAAVLRAKVGPPPGKRDEAGIEAVNFGLADKFSLPSLRVGTDESGDMGEFTSTL